MTHPAHAHAHPTANDAPHPPVWRAVGYVATSTDAIEATVTTLEERLGAILSPPTPIASAPSTPPGAESPIALELRELSGRLDRVRDRILTLLDRAEI